MTGPIVLNFLKASEVNTQQTIYNLLRRRSTKRKTPKKKKWIFTSTSLCDRFVLREFLRGREGRGVKNLFRMKQEDSSSHQLMTGPVTRFYIPIFDLVSNCRSKRRQNKVMGFQWINCRIQPYHGSAKNQSNGCKVCLATIIVAITWS